MEALLQQMMDEWNEFDPGGNLELFRSWLAALLLETSGAELTGVATDASIVLDTNPYVLQIALSGLTYRVGPILSPEIFTQETADLARGVGELIALEVEAHIHYIEDYEAWLETQELIEEAREHMNEIYDRMAEDAEHYHDHDHPDHDEHEHGS